MSSANPSDANSVWPPQTADDGGKAQVGAFTGPGQGEDEPTETKGVLDERKEANHLISLYRSKVCSGVVEIILPSGQRFEVLGDFLIERSPYFRAALTGGFLEARTRQITLEDVSDTTFAFFLKWLYSGSICSEKKGRDAAADSKGKAKAESTRSCPGKFRGECNMTWSGLFDLWFFADYIGAPALQNHVMFNLIQKVTSYPDASAQGHANTGEILAAIRMLWGDDGLTTRGEIGKPLCSLLGHFCRSHSSFPSKDAMSLYHNAGGSPAPFFLEEMSARISRLPFTAFGSYQPCNAALLGGSYGVSSGYMGYGLCYADWFNMAPDIWSIYAKNESYFAGFFVKEL